MRVLQWPMRALCVPVRSFFKRLCARPLIKPCVYFHIPCVHFMPAVRAHGFLWKVNAFGNWCAHFQSYARARNFFCAYTSTFESACLSLPCAVYFGVCVHFGSAVRTTPKGNNGRFLKIVFLLYFWPQATNWHGIMLFCSKNDKCKIFRFFLSGKILKSKDIFNSQFFKFWAAIATFYENGLV